jgi:hypothetical protein
METPLCAGEAQCDAPARNGQHRPRQVHTCTTGSLADIWGTPSDPTLNKATLNLLKLRVQMAGRRLLVKVQGVTGADLSKTAHARLPLHKTGVANHGCSISRLVAGWSGQVRSVVSPEKSSHVSTIECVELASTRRISLDF